MIVRAQSACEAGWVRYNGNVEVARLNSIQDGRPPTAIAGNSGNDLPVCQGGTTFARVGKEFNSNGQPDVFRLFIRFPLSDTPASAGTVNLKIAEGRSVSGVTPVGLVHLYHVDLTGVYPEGPSNAAGESFPEFWTPAVLTDLGILPGVTPDAMNTYEVTAAYNAAKAAGRTDIWFGLKLEDETLNNTVPEFWTVGTAEYPDPQFRPQLEILNPVKQIKPQRPVNLRLSLLEPCVAVVNIVLHASHDRQDFEVNDRVHIVRRGNALRIEVKIIDRLTEPGAPYLGAAYITLTAADGTVVLTHQQMERVAPGQFEVVYRTQLTDPLGLYLAKVELT